MILNRGFFRMYFIQHRFICCPSNSSFRRMLKSNPALQTHSTENSKQILPKMKLRGFVPNSYIHVSVNDRYINRSQIHECRNCERGRAVSFLGIHKTDLVCKRTVATLTLAVRDSNPSARDLIHKRGLISTQLTSKIKKSKHAS